MRRLLACLLLVVGSSPLLAGEFNPTLSIGDAAPQWAKLPGVDGKEHALDDFKAKDVVVLFFTCNSCEYAIDYEDRIIALAKKYRTAFISKARCQVQAMSAEVISLPAQLLIPGRMWKVQVLKSSLPSHRSTHRPTTP